MAAKILLVEDENGMVELVTMILSRNNYDLIYADSFATAVEALMTNKPDVVLLNFFFPNVSGGKQEDIGLILLKLIRDRWPSIKVIMFTGSTDKVSQAGQLGAFGYVLKGENFVPEKFCKIIGLAIESNQRSQGKMIVQPAWLAA